MPDERRAIDERRAADAMEQAIQSYRLMYEGPDTGPTHTDEIRLYQARDAYLEVRIRVPDHHDEPRSPTAERDGREVEKALRQSASNLGHTERDGTGRLGDLLLEAANVIASLRPANTPRPEERELREAAREVLRRYAFTTDPKDGEAVEDLAAMRDDSLARLDRALSDHGSEG